MTPQERKVMELALDFVEDVYLGEWRGPTERQEEAITAIKEALAQPEQEPVVVMELYTVGWDLVENIDIDWLESLPLGTKLYAHSPVQKLGITEEEFKNDKYA